MATRQWSYERAVVWVRDIRPVVAPNEGFERELIKFEALFQQD